jgi:hypothetical protein
MTLAELSTVLFESPGQSSFPTSTRFPPNNRPFLIDIVQLCGALTVHQHESVNWQAEDRPPIPLKEDHSTTANEGDLLVLAHSSVRVWLVQMADSRTPIVMKADVAHGQLAKTALSFVLWKVNSLSTPSCICEYATREWPYHARISSTLEVRHLATQVLTTHSSGWREWFRTSGAWEEIYSLLYATSLHGLFWAVGPLIEGGCDVNALGGTFGSPLQAAIVGCDLRPSEKI